MPVVGIKVDTKEKKLFVTQLKEDGKSIKKFFLDAAALVLKKYPEAVTGLPQVEPEKILEEISSRIENKIYYDVIAAIKEKKRVVSLRELSNDLQISKYALQEILGNSGVHYLAKKYGKCSVFQELNTLCANCWALKEDGCYFYIIGKSSVDWVKARIDLKYERIRPSKLIEES